MKLEELKTEIERGGGAEALDAALIELHHSRDPKTLCALHKLAARYWKDDPQQVAFHQTHAYVYALEGGIWDEVDGLHATLLQAGRI